MLENKSILVIITGGVAAYKALELIRLLKKQGAQVKAILTKGGAEFITALSVSSLTGEKTYTDLFSLTDETEMGHIQLSRACDLVLIAPTSADFMAKMAHGLANDLATTCVLASDKPVMIAPAMNPQMWANPATQDNLKTLERRGIHILMPDAGEMACGELGLGRMQEPENILKAVQDFFFDKPLKGKRAIVTSGPTYEPLDPVRFLGNRSSGKQGHAIAKALAVAGAHVTLISGPTQEPDPAGVTTIHIETAQEMLKACMGALPSDIAICAAAVSDWRAKTPAEQKIKKANAEDVPQLELTQNPDILHTLSKLETNRPTCVIGFAAETENLIENAQKKLTRKGCDLIVANDVGKNELGQEKAFGSQDNEIYLVSSTNVNKWERMDKVQIAHRLVNSIVEILGRDDRDTEHNH